MPSPVRRIYSSSTIAVNVSARAVEDGVGITFDAIVLENTLQSLAFSCKRDKSSLVKVSDVHKGFHVIVDNGPLEEGRILVKSIFQKELFGGNFRIYF
jgi:hypothetical protein